MDSKFLFLFFWHKRIKIELTHCERNNQDAEATGEMDSKFQSDLYHYKTGPVIHFFSCLGCKLLYIYFSPYCTHM
jgi:hypothetical protein